jgi:AraC-like DNA-binding protein
LVTKLYGFDRSSKIKFGGGNSMPLSIVVNEENYSKYTHFIPYIRYCAEDKYYSPWELNRRKISDYELIFITEGEGLFVIGDRTYEVSPNDLIFLKPEVFHSGKSLTTPFKFLCMHFDLYVSKPADDLQMLKQAYYETIPLKPVKYHKAVVEFPEHIAISNSSHVHMLFRRIINETERQLAGFNSVIKSIFTDLLINLYRQKCSQLPENIRSNEVLLAVDYIKSNYMNRITLTDLSNHVHLQPTYLSGLFKKQTGHSVTEFINLHRISVSKKLLLETNRKIHDIANDVGFYDLHHFSRVFKKYEGLTPVQYRQIRL